MPCHTMPCHAASCHAAPDRVRPCHALPCTRTCPCCVNVHVRMHMRACVDGCVCVACMSLMCAAAEPSFDDCTASCVDSSCFCSDATRLSSTACGESSIEHSIEASIGDSIEPATRQRAGAASSRCRASVRPHALPLKCAAHFRRH